MVGKKRISAVWDFNTSMNPMKTTTISQPRITDWFVRSPEEELREDLYAQILVATRDQIAELWKTESTK